MRKLSSSRRVRAAITSGALLGALVVAIASSGTVSGDGGLKDPRVLGLTATPAACSAPAFCISSPNPGPTLNPGATASSFPLTITNPLPEPIVVDSVTATLGALPAGCLASDFKLNGTSFTGSPAKVTLSPNQTVAANTSAAIAPASVLAFANRSANQDPCKSTPGHIVTLSFTFGGSAHYTIPTTTSLTSSLNPSKFGQPVTFTATISPTDTAPSKPTGTVNFYTCATAACASTTSLGAGTAVNGVASLTTSTLGVGSYIVRATYVGDVAHNFSGSTSATVTQVVNYTTCVTGTQNGGFTIRAGESSCVTPTGVVNGGITVQPGGALTMTGGRVNGAVSSSGAASVKICGADVNGGVTVTGTTGPVLIGDGGDDGTPGCAGNTISGGLTVSNNSKGVEVGGNTIKGGMTFTNNTGAGPNAGNPIPEIERNDITGGLSCSPSSMAVTNGGLPNTVKGTKTGPCAAAGF